MFILDANLSINIYIYILSISLSLSIYIYIYISCISCISCMYVNDKWRSHPLQRPASRGGALIGAMNDEAAAPRLRRQGLCPVRF